MQQEVRNWVCFPSELAAMINRALTTWNSSTGVELAGSKIYSSFHKYQGRLGGYGPDWKNQICSAAVGGNPSQVACGKG